MSHHKCSVDDLELAVNYDNLWCNSLGIAEMSKNANATIGAPNPSSGQELQFIRHPSAARNPSAHSTVDENGTKFSTVQLEDHVFTLAVEESTGKGTLMLIP